MASLELTELIFLIEPNSAKDISHSTTFKIVCYSLFLLYIYQFRANASSYCWRRPLPRHPLAEPMCISRQALSHGTPTIAQRLLSWVCFVFHQDLLLHIENAYGKHCLWITLCLKPNNTHVFPSALCSRSPCKQKGLVASQAAAARNSMLVIRDHDSTTGSKHALQGVQVEELISRVKESILKSKSMNKVWIQ